MPYRRRTGPLPAVLVIHEIWGLNDDIRSICDRIAAQGYVAAAPDLYSNGPKAICVARTVFDMIRKGDTTVGRIDGIRRWLGDQPEVDRERIGAVGFCMGGGFVLLAALRGGFAAIAANYGVVPNDLAGICPVVGSYGALDRQFAAQAERLDADLDRLAVPHDVKIYPGAGHSFMNRSKPKWAPAILHLDYKAEAAEDAWRRIFAFFGEHVV